MENKIVITLQKCQEQLLPKPQISKQQGQKNKPYTQQSEVPRLLFNKQPH